MFQNITKRKYISAYVTLTHRIEFDGHATQLSRVENSKENIGWNIFLKMSLQGHDQYAAKMAYFFLDFIQIRTHSTNIYIERIAFGFE